MGMFDSVYIPCPACGAMVEDQSKSGDCMCIDYTLDDCPSEILADYIGEPGEPPYRIGCPKCGIVFEVVLPRTIVTRAVQGVSCKCPRCGAPDDFSEYPDNGIQVCHSCWTAEQRGKP